jgi:glycine betaine catabolism A
MEGRVFWPRVRLMACRLEEILEAGDFVEYGAKLVKGPGSCASVFVCSFHGSCYGLDRANTFIYQPDLFAEHNRRPEDLGLKAVRFTSRACGCWRAIRRQRSTLLEPAPPSSWWVAHVGE